MRLKSVCAVCYLLGGYEGSAYYDSETGEHTCEVCLSTITEPINVRIIEVSSEYRALTALRAELDEFERAGGTNLLRSARVMATIERAARGLEDLSGFVAARALLARLDAGGEEE